MVTRKTHNEFEVVKRFLAKVNDFSAKTFTFLLEKGVTIKVWDISMTDL